MQKPIIPANELERVQSLHDLDILEIPLIPSFERLTHITKILFEIPMVAITLIDSERQWLKSKQGLNFCETTRDLSFCAHAINQEDIFIVNDTLLDSCFYDHPSVINEPHIRFYAGYPILSPLGYKIGTICIMDSKPRVFSGEKLNCLKEIGGLVEAEIVALKNNFHQKRLMQALKDEKPEELIDPLTQIWSHRGIEKLLIQQMQSAKDHHEEFGIGLINIDDFALINDKYGNEAINIVLQEVSKRILSACREFDFIGRWEEGKFLVIMNGNHPSELMTVAERLRKSVCDNMISYQNMLLPISITIKINIWRPTNSLNAEQFIHKLDKQCEADHGVKNKVVCDF